jgi:hypothetical protein
MELPLLRLFPSFLSLSVAVSTAALTSSCSFIDPPKEDVDYANYEKIPVLPTSKVYRRLLKAIPIIRGKVFYGRYGGFGNKGGEPIDPLDELFRKHDIVYYEANHYPAMVTADYALVEALIDLDPGVLDRRGQKFRERTILYFGSPSILVVGKPATSPWPRLSRPTAFANADSIRRFMTDPVIKTPNQVAPIPAPMIDDDGSSN